MYRSTARSDTKMINVPKPRVYSHCKHLSFREGRARNNFLELLSSKEICRVLSPAGEKKRSDPSISTASKEPGEPGSRQTRKNLIDFTIYAASCSLFPFTGYYLRQASLTPDNSVSPENSLHPSFSTPLSLLSVSRLSRPFLFPPSSCPSPPWKASFFSPSLPARYYVPLIRS